MVLCKLYRLDEPARRMRRIVLTVIFAAALSIVIGQIVYDLAVK